MNALIPPISEMESRLVVHETIGRAAGLFGISPAKIAGYSRRKDHAEARQWVYLEAHEAGVPMAAIGRAMDRDHTTVMHGIARERIRREMTDVPMFKSIRGARP